VPPRVRAFIEHLSGHFADPPWGRAADLCRPGPGHGRGRLRASRWNPY